MSRFVLPESMVHPTVREVVAGFHAPVVEQVRAAVARDAVVVVGMAQNPWPRKARRALDAAGVAHTYLSFGSYFSGWRQRLALKMWCGWPMFPMVFVKGQLVGGAQDLDKLIASGELQRLLAA